MIVLIPIGGIGNRFKENGYTKPKALINVFGKSILSYLLENLNLDKIEYIVIPYNKVRNNVGKRFPVNIIVLIGFTFCSSWVITILCVENWTTVWYIFGITVIVFLVLTLIAIKGKFDFTYFGWRILQAICIAILLCKYNIYNK